MNKEEFTRLFKSALELAAANAERELGREVPRRIQIRLHGAGQMGDLIELDRASEILYLGEDRFYRIIDVAVMEVRRQSTVCFVRASDHRAVPFEQTWNTPPGSGPFKQLVAEEIKVSEG